MIKTTTINTLVSDALLASNTTASEAPLQMALESALEVACKEAGAPWLPYNIEVALKNTRGKTQFADAIHEACRIIQKNRLKGKKSSGQIQNKAFSADIFGIFVSNRRFSRIGDGFILGRQ